MKNKLLIVVAGPTAVGKTELCVHLAKRLDCQILSADSRQFYREMSIGTAKPTENEMGRVVHHFVDFLSINEEFSAGKYELAAIALLSKLFKKAHCAIMTGGSGLYIQAVCQGMNDIPAVDRRFREELYRELKLHGLDLLVEELRIKDPDYYENVDKRNPQRVIRALEICRGTGQPYSHFRKDKIVDREFEVLKIGLDRDREELLSRIDHRMDAMIGNGLFEEAERLQSSRHLNALKTVGYTEIFDHLDGKYDREEAIRLLKRNSRRYAKRQLTWFIKDSDYTWFHPADKHAILDFARERLRSTLA